MKNLDNINENATKDNKRSEISKKQDVNLTKNSSLYFQIGLILCLLATYELFEMNFKKSILNFQIEEPTTESAEFYLPNIKIVPDVVEQEQPERKLAVLITKPPVIKPDDFVIKAPLEMVTPESAPIVDTSKPNPTPRPASVETPVNKPFNMKDVERVPVFPGCESASSNEERMACMSEKLTKLIQRKFNTDLAADLGLSGVQKIYVQFRIDDQGRVTDIQSRSPYSQLEKEAERVVSKIPVMTPGMQRNTPVSVIYNLPIAFQVQ